MITEIKEIGNKISHSKSSTSTIMDQLYSVGERMSSLIFADLLKLRMPKNEIVFFDARKVIKTNSDFSKAEPQIDLINEKTQLELIPLLNKPNTIVVTQGFIGQDLMGNTTTLGREGSDYSAALIGEAIDAHLIQIWTDVDGVASSDPRVISNVNYIEKLTYDEATAMATLGAKVLFPRTLLPAKRKGIPVFVGSSLNPLKRGTIIVNKLDESPQVKVVTGQKIEGVNYLSFVGCHLDKKVEILDSLKQLLIKEHHSFSFYDFTSVSITFTFQVLSINEALKIGHHLLGRI
jgi:aspartate kinase